MNKNNLKTTILGAGSLQMLNTFVNPATVVTGGRTINDRTGSA